ncbi:MAG: hypothetical protein M3463_20795 [Verrucomicrobiota bacterium]|nr:hypothetical protein [Verrucomicrobiota bacterium]
MRAVRRMRRALNWAPIAVWAATIAAALIGTRVLAEWFYPLQIVWRFPSILFIVSILLAGFTRRQARRALLGGASELNPVSERLLRIVIGFACVLLLFLRGGVRQWSCPHGSGFGIGPAGIAHSTVGGPCRNTVSYSKKWNVGGPWYVWVEFS